MEKAKLLIVGFGNQAKTWAQNLQDSQFDVTIGLRRSSPSLDLARKLHLHCLELDDSSLTHVDQLALLIPDHQHRPWLTAFASKLPHGCIIILAHGHSFVAHQLDKLFPHLCFALLAPKAIASEMRQRYLNKKMLSGVYGPETLPEKTKNIIKSLATGLGFTHGPFLADFSQETTADLLSEQALLCGAIPYLALECFQLLRKNNIPPELAYLECWHELKLIVDAMTEMGPIKFFEAISPNALLGAEKARKILFDETFKTNIKRLFEEIRNGEFDRQVNASDVDVVKKQVSDFWQKQELTELDKKLR